ncbi:hypothetical protein FC831_13820 [Clostridium botulinum]|nr:hypothetical protein [Clostridium botulinum]
MDTYVLDWCIAYIGRVPHTLMTEINNRLAIDNTRLVIVEGEDYTFKLHRSLDIAMPIILTKAIGYRIDCFRDNLRNRFVIRISK